MLITALQALSMDATQTLTKGLQAASTMKVTNHSTPRTNGGGNSQLQGTASKQSMQQLLCTCTPKQQQYTNTMSRKANQGWINQSKTRHHCCTLCRTQCTQTQITRVPHFQHTHNLGPLIWSTNQHTISTIAPYMPAPETMPSAGATGGAASQHQRRISMFSVSM